MKSLNPLTVTPIQTPIFHANENIIDFITKHIPQRLIQEKMIIAVTSKIVSLSENCLVKKESVDKKTLVQNEADHYLGELDYGVHLTIKEGMLIASAGIDESNSENSDYILYPTHPYESAKKIWSELKKKWHLKELGVLLTDSHTTPLRQGVTGICLSHWGFEGVKNQIGTEDLFGRKLQMTKINFADAFSTMAVAVMGEGSEACPLAIIYGAQTRFCEDINPEELRMPLNQDMYQKMILGSLKT